MLDEKLIKQDQGPVGGAGGAGARSANPRPAPLLQAGVAWAAWTVVTVAAFSTPVKELVRESAHSALYSHILLMPFVSAYLIWLQRRHLALPLQPSRGLCLLPLLAGLALVSSYWLGRRSGWQPNSWDYLCLMTAAWLCFVVGGSWLFFGREFLGQLALPISLLVFMVPFPELVQDGIESFFQHGSAVVAGWMFGASGMPVLREGTCFHLPGIPLMEVAPECSGIHSSLVLLITSLVAGYMFLRSPWRRLALTIAVIPLALLRNGLRIFTLGQLGVHVGNWIFDSPIHRRGGPIFFALSLIPFFLLLFWLRKSEPPPKGCEQLKHEHKP